MGFSLIELVIAFSMLTIVLTGSMQALLQHFQLLRVREELVSASQNCEGLLSEIRRTRDTAAGVFPGKVVAVFPQNGTTPGVGADLTTLSNEQLTVTYVNPNATPLEITIISNWTDFRGRPMTTRLSTILTQE